MEFGTQAQIYFHQLPKSRKELPPGNGILINRGGGGPEQATKKGLKPQRTKRKGACGNLMRREQKRKSQIARNRASKRMEEIDR